MDLNAYFDELYRREGEPWSYSARAAESLRHDEVAATARSLRPSYARILDLGCSVGQLTARMAGLGQEIVGVDVSPTALLSARARCLGVDPRGEDGSGTATGFHFCAGGSLAPPLRPGSFDLQLVCDGLHSWRLSPEEQAAVLREVHELATPGGYVILTEHLKAAHFDPFLERIESSPLEVLSIRYLHNRLWYTFERALRPVKHWRSARRALASKRVGRALMLISRLAGRRGAKHLCVVARRPQIPAA